MRAAVAVTHCCSLVGSDMWHLELIRSDSMETSSCGIVNRLRDWKDEQESGFCCFSTNKGHWGRMRQNELMPQEAASRVTEVQSFGFFAHVLENLS